MKVEIRMIVRIFSVMMAMMVICCMIVGTESMKIDVEETIYVNNEAFEAEVAPRIALTFDDGP